MKQISLFIITVFLASCTQNSKVPEKKKEFNLDSLLSNQILLTNSAKFTNERFLEGASSFLIKYEDSIYAVTARHLLGEAGGVEPEVKIGELDTCLISWKMFPRIPFDTIQDTVVASAKNLNYENSYNDILFLEVLSKNKQIEFLKPNFEIPKLRDTLVLVGCPYSEGQCRQNVYKIIFAGFDEKNSLLIFELNSDFELAGFSGAPVINKNGEVVGALVSGGPDGGKNYVYATHIREIKQLK